MRCSRTTRERLDGGQMAARQVVNTFYGLKSKQLLRLMSARFPPPPLSPPTIKVVLAGRSVSQISDTR